MKEIDSPNSTPDRLFTWVNVEEHFTRLATANQWPGWLQEADAFWDAIELTVAEGTATSEVRTWMELAFGPGSILSQGQLRLSLDAEPHGRTERELPIYIDETPMSTLRRDPTWRAGRIVRELGEPLLPPESRFDGDVKFLAFHSYKGGVGRTLHAVALADEIANRGSKVLLIDADLEAPGISWMFTHGGRRVDFAFDDFLALLHSSESGNGSEAINFASALLPNQSDGRVYIMPARRDGSETLSPRIRPNDLLTPGRSRYYLNESIVRLASHMGIDVVIVDLRAGKSELSSSILLDPRVQRVFVTTVSEQSLAGTAQTIALLGQRAPSRLDDPPSVAIITQFRDQGHEELTTSGATRLRDAISESLSDPILEPDILSDRDLLVEPLFSPFHDALLGLPGDWSEVVKIARRQQLPDILSPLVDQVVGALGIGAGIGEKVNPERQPDARKELADFADNLVFAETASDSEFLPTESLRKLLASHRTEVPICVVTGAKGSGKTFTQIQMCFREDWASYAKAVRVEGVTLHSPMVPVLVSRSLNPATQDRIEALQRSAATDTGGGVDTHLSIRDSIQEGLDSEISDREWRRLWLNCMARSIGLESTRSTAEQVLTEFASMDSRIFLFDGLEDVLQSVSTSETEQRALRVLLVDCVEWLRSVRGRALGLVVFVRRDLVLASIKQNSGQFLAKYREYALKWNPSEALRLALWVAQRSGALAHLTTESVVTARDEEMSLSLLSLWGEKMGSERSREARSENWFLAALSDFNGQIQARDIVSFLKESASLSIGDPKWSDRILSPVAMRNALPRCSSEKIKAISEESPHIGALLNTLNGLAYEKKQVPFVQEAVNVSQDDLEVLRVNGIVFREEDQYWIPEIYRHGLGFRAAGRPRILAIANLVRQRNNLD